MSSVPWLYSALRSGANLSAVWGALKTRDIVSQGLDPRRVDFAFLTSMPFTMCQTPWVIEIEDVVTLFAPFIYNDQTKAIDIRKHGCFLPIKALLEDKSCKAIICHVESTAESVHRLFQSEKVSKKVHRLALGVKPSEVNVNRIESPTVNILFTNSWHQAASSFYVRGGLHLLRAFRRIEDKFPHARLWVRSQLPEDLPDEYWDYIRDSPRVTIFPQKLPLSYMEDLLQRADIFALPSSRLHVVSILQAKSFGLPIVTTDGWGISDYTTEGVDSLWCHGFKGVTSWIGDDGMLHEDYSHTRKPAPAMEDQIVEHLSKLIADRELRLKMGAAARQSVETGFNLTQWNAGLKAIFDKIQT